MKKKCPLVEKDCRICGKAGYLAKKCRMADGGVAGAKPTQKKQDAEGGQAQQKGGAYAVVAAALHIF